MKQTFLLLTAICISVLAIHACKKTPPPEPDNSWGLPNATQEGKNIFACRVNGENWIAENRLYSPLNLSFRDSALSFSGDSEGTNLIVDIKNEKIQISKNYSLDSSGGSFGGFLGMWANCKSSHYFDFIKLCKSYDGEAIVTKIDTNKKFVSGTFHFKIIIPDCDTLNVTDGRFDIRYN